MYENEQSYALPAPQEYLLGEEYRDRQWLKAALEGEFTLLSRLPEGESINKSDSIFFGSLLRLGAITKGTGRSYLMPSSILENINTLCHKYPWFSEKEIERQWQNAYNLANPRYRIKKHVGSR